MRWRAIAGGGERSRLEGSGRRRKGVVSKAQVEVEESYCWLRGAVSGKGMESQVQGIRIVIRIRVFHRPWR